MKILHLVFIYLFSVKRVIQINYDSDEERTIQAVHSPAVIETISSSDTEEETPVYSSLSQRQKKVSRVLWMDEPVQMVTSIPHNIDGITVYKIKARNRVLLLEAVKDGRKWNKDSRTEWAGFYLCKDIEIAQVDTHVPNTECLFF